MAVLLAIVAIGCGSATGPTATPAASTSVTPTVPTQVPGANASLPAMPAADNVPYATQSEAQRLDLYVPSTGSGPYPLVVVIHGGGWTTGDKRGELPLSAVPWLLEHGYAVANVNYRLASEATFPAPLLDVKAAVRHLRGNAGQLNVDPQRVAAIGESAGAHLALLLGTTAEEPSFDDAALGNAGVSSAVEGVVDYYGPADLATSDAQRRLNRGCPAEPDPNIALLLGASPSAAPDRAAAASPVTYLRQGRELPPFFITHGDADCVVPFQQSMELHDAIEQVAPGRSTLKIVPGSGHYLDFDFNSVKDAVTNFLASSLQSN